MAKTEGGGHCFELFCTSRLLRCCLVIVTVGPICLTTATDATGGPAPTVKCVTPVSKYGDSPLWDEEKQCVFFVDAVEKTINRYQPDNNEFVSAKINIVEDLKFLVPLSEMIDMFVIGYRTDIGQFVWDGKTTDEINNQLFLPIINLEGEVVCCSKADSSKRLWVGTSYPTTDPPGTNVTGRLYMTTKDGNVTVMKDGIGVPTGLTWNADNNKLYYVDSLDEGTVVFDFKAQNVEGVPNGITIDTDGNLWVACLKSSHVVKIDPNSKTKLTEVVLPTACGITNVVFGGPEFKDLYVTTAEEPSKPESGALFCVTGTGSTGIAGMGTDAAPVPDKTLQNGPATPQ